MLVIALKVVVALVEVLVEVVIDSFAVTAAIAALGKAKRSATARNKGPFDPMLLAIRLR